jgi:hypothetical protein
MVSIEDKRAHKRFETNIRYMAVVNDSSLVSIKNISIGGISLTLPLEMERQSVASIDIISGEERLISLTGTVTWSTFWGHSTVNPDISFYETGFKFGELDEKTEEALRELIKSIKE